MVELLRFFRVSFMGVERGTHTHTHTKGPQPQPGLDLHTEFSEGSPTPKEVALKFLYQTRTPDKSQGLPLQTLLCLLSRNMLWISSNWRPLSFLPPAHYKTGGVFVVSVFQETKHENSSKLRGKFGAKFRAKFGSKSLKIWDSSFCAFSDLTTDPLRHPLRT